MQFEYDPENLIHVVSKRPGIWDYEHPDYREKKLRMKLWHEVVQELMQTDVTMTKGEMRELELQLQKKWKSLRDCFQKYVSNPHKSKRPYLYSKQLHFLLKDQKLPQKRSAVLRKEEGSVESADEDEERKPRWKPRKKFKLSRQEDPSEDEDDVGIQDQEDSDDFSVKPTPSSSKLSNHIESGQFAFASVDTVRDDDPDRMFLMSLLPHLKSIPEEFRLNAKMELMQVLQQANFSIAKLV